MKSQELKDFVRIMLAAMKDAPGVGLAAPQLGVPLRIIVFRDPCSSWVSACWAEAPCCWYRRCHRYFTAFHRGAP
jgi:peptide deformylase